MHDRVRREWRHLDFFQSEAWLYADIPRVDCTNCGKTTQIPVPWAREASGFRLLFEALALTMCQRLQVRQAAQMLRVRDKQLWGRIEHYAEARPKQNMSGVKVIGIDETNMRKGHEYVAMFRDLDSKRLLFATPGKDHKTVYAFAARRQLPQPPRWQSGCSVLHRAGPGTRFGSERLAGLAWNAHSIRPD